MASVWISRPLHRCTALVRQLAQYDINAALYPAITIAEVEDDSAMRAYAAQAEHFALSIFVSAEAARRIVALLPAGAPLPALAVGKATAAALAARYQLVLPANDIGDSATLLQTTLLQKQVGNIAVLGGSDAAATPPSPPLCAALAERGNTLTPVVCYQRQSSAPSAALNQQGSSGLLDAATAYSSDSLRAMLAMTAPNNDWLRALPLFVVHDNIAVCAAQLGFGRVIVASADTMAQTIHQQLKG